MIVVVLLGALWFVDQFFITGLARPDRARMRATQATIRVIESAVKNYKADNGHYPASLQTLVDEKYFDRVFKDSWKQDLRYARPGTNGKDYSLVSSGADGEFGTDDDIDVWRIDEDER